MEKQRKIRGKGGKRARNGLEKRKLSRNENQKSKVRRKKRRKRGDNEKSVGLYEGWPAMTAWLLRAVVAIRIR